MSDHPHRYFFVHIMKTAGVALRRRLMHHFGENAVYPTGRDGNDPLRPYLLIDRLREQLATRGDQIQVITGHFPLCTVELIDGPVTTLTLLRDPVERTTSYLRQQWEIERSDRFSYLRRYGEPERFVQHESLEDIYEDPLHFHGMIHNHMTKMLSLTSAEMTEGMLTPVHFTRDRLERAKESLVAIDAVGLQEDFENFCDELASRFGWSLGGSQPAYAGDPIEVPEDFRDRIAEDNALDVELYQFANQLLAPSFKVGGAGG